MTTTPISSFAHTNTYALPEDPNDNDLIEAPEGCAAGGSQVIAVHLKSNRIGFAWTLSAVPNVTRKYLLERVHTYIPLVEDSIIHIQAQIHEFTHLKFLEGYGWVGYRDPSTTEKKTVIHDSHHRITGCGSAHIAKDKCGADRLFLYDQIFLSKVV